MKNTILFLFGTFIVCFSVTCRKKDKDICPVCPQINSFSPSHGKKGDMITLTGVNFTTEPDGLKLKVSINGVDAVIKNRNDTQVQLIVPDKCGTGPIKVYYDDELYSESASSFVYDFVAIVSTIAGKGGTGTDDNSDPLLARFFYPEKVFLDEPRDIIYVINESSQTLRRIDKAGVTTIISGITTPIQSGVCDKSGNVYLAFSNYIARVDHSLNYYLTPVAGVDTAGHADGKGAKAKFNGINDLLLDDAENIYVAENTYIRKMDPAFNVTTIAGTASAGYLDGPALTAKFNSIFSIALENNVLYIADWKNNRMRKLAAGSVSTIAGDGVQAIRNGIGTAAQLQAPRSVIVNNSNMLYFSDSFTSLIRKIDLNNSEVSFFSGDITQTGDVNGPAETALYMQPSGFAYSKKSNAFYLADFFNCKIKKVAFE